tara:strand:- start:1219 stop:1857 length:639 start_codon:yes stop_codon:yes gene_type:complete
MLNRSLSEEEIRDILLNNLDLIEEGLVPLKVEYKLKDNSRIDIFCLDQFKHPLIIEVKVKANSKAIEQIYNYEFVLSTGLFSNDNYIRKVIFCSSATKEMVHMCELSNIKFVEVDNQTLFLKSNIWNFKFPYITKKVVWDLKSTKKFKSSLALAINLDLYPELIERHLNFIRRYIPLIVRKDSSGKLFYQWPQEADYIDLWERELPRYFWDL